MAHKCVGGCDRSPQELSAQVMERSAAKEADATRLKPYVTPRNDRIPVDDNGPKEDFGANGEHKFSEMYSQGGHGDWPQQILDLTKEEARSLAVITLRVQSKEVRGGKAPTTNLKKTGVVTAHWRKTEITSNLTEKATAAYEWLMQYNPSYKSYVDQHRALLKTPAEARSQDWFVIKTAKLLLAMLGVEVAARPWLYPVAEFGDTDIKSRLLQLDQISERQLPSIKSSWVRKLTSRCVSYEEDFELFSLLYDISLAKQITSVVAIAQRQEIAPEEAASHLQNFDAFWTKETEKLEDMCRQHSAMPNFYMTVAPAEWKAIWHRGLQHWRKVTGSLSAGQAIMTLHLNNVLGAILKDFLQQGDCFRSAKESSGERVFHRDFHKMRSELGIE